MMQATLGQVWDGVGAIEKGEKAGRVMLVGAAAGLGDWEGAGVIPSPSPTCSGAAIEPSFARSPAVGKVDWCAHLRVVLVRGAGWP